MSTVQIGPASSVGGSRHWRLYLRAAYLFRAAWSLIIAGSLLSAALRLPMPLLTARLIDRVISAHDLWTLNRVAVALVALTALYETLNYGVEYLSFKVHRSLVIRFRLRLLKHVYMAPLIWSMRQETGYLMARISADPVFLNGLGAQLLSILTSVFTLAVGVAALLMINVRVALVSLAVLPLFAGSFIVFQRRLRTLDHQQKEQAAVVSRSLKESLSHLSSVKLFRLQPRECHRYLRGLRQELRVSIRGFNCEYAISALSDFFAAMGPLFVIWSGGYEVMQNRLSVGQLVACGSLLALLYGATRAIVTSNIGIVRALVSLDRVAEILALTGEGSAMKHPRSAWRPTHFGIDFGNVSFGYSSLRVLANLSFSVPDGSALGIVGPIGSGKSTLLQLIPRFYDPTEGTVFVGGDDIRKTSLVKLRSRVSFMSQAPFLVSASVYENIRLGNPRASRAEIVSAAERANALPFIESLERGIDSEVGENGYRLSGGQKQLICLARAILRDCPILILDEPTSSVDAETERLMQRSLAAAMRGRTTIVVSHRLSSVLSLDRIAVLEHGTVRDIGSHAELMRRNPFYSQTAGLPPVEHPSMADPLAHRFGIAARASIQPEGLHRIDQ